MDKKQYRRNYYLEHMEIEKAQMKIYRENNPDKIKELQKEYRENNKEYFAEYSKEYRENNFDAIKKYKKQFYEKNRRESVYLLVNKELKVLYCGSTSNIYKRTENHLGSWSHLELTKEKWDSLECSHFEYCYLDNVTKEERLYVEKIIIDKFEPILNEYEPIRFNKITEDRKAELEEMADALIFKMWNK